MQAELIVGALYKGDGSLITARAGRTGEIIVGDAHGKYQEAVSRGNCYFAANTAAQAVTLGVAAGTGIALENPFGSGKNLVVLGVSASLAAAVTAVADVALFLNQVISATAYTHTAALTPLNALVGGAAGVAKVDSSWTAPAAPVLMYPLFGYQWLTGANGHTAQIAATLDLAGSIILQPGTALSIQGLIAVNSILGGFFWEEVTA